MKRNLVSLTLCLAMAAAANADPKTVTAKQVPPAVLKTILAQSGGKEPSTIEKDAADGDVTYAAVISTGPNQERTITVAEDGTLLTVEVALEETPAAVQKTIQAQLHGGALDGIAKSIENGDTIYDVDFTTKAGQQRGLSVAEDGALLSIELALEETPPSVQDTIKTQVGAGKLGEIDKVIDDSAVSFEIGFTTKAGTERSFTVAESGNLVSLEVALEDITPAAQKTVRNRIGGGSILRVSETRGEKQRITGYEIEGLVDGKPMNFKVGLKGKFLGLTD